MARARTRGGTLNAVKLVAVYVFAMKDSRLSVETVDGVDGGGSLCTHVPVAGVVFNNLRPFGR